MLPITPPGNLYRTSAQGSCEVFRYTGLFSVFAAAASFWSEIGAAGCCDCGPSSRLFVPERKFELLDELSPNMRGECTF